MTNRAATVTRTTTETNTHVTLNVDGSGIASINTGIGFLDHMIEAFALHSRFDITMSCIGDLDVDDHHTVEDCAIGMGNALDTALGTRSGIRRFGSAYVPLDESLTRSVIDLSGRPFSSIALDFRREFLGALSTENVSHFFTSFASNARLCLHVDRLRGTNDHHVAESAFKAVAVAMREAIVITEPGRVPSTKGTLESGA